MTKTTLIQPHRTLSKSDFEELYAYRELWLTLVQRDIQVRYKQTLIGSLWAILQPLTTMIIFSFFFGKIAKMPSDGIPYPIFSYAGLLLWTYFSNSVTAASNSLIANAGLISKVYFPRLLIPLAAATVGLIDYAIASVILFGLMVYYQFFPTYTLFFLPLILAGTWVLAAGVGLWLSATNVLFRDVKFVVTFLLQLWIYATPVIYPLSVAGQFKWLVMLNPMSGFIEAHRAWMLGLDTIPAGVLLFSTVLTLSIFVTGFWYFKSIERRFADLI